MSFAAYIALLLGLIAVPYGRFTSRPAITIVGTILFVLGFVAALFL